jgi:hypothetical protein
MKVVGWLEHQFEESLRSIKAGSDMVVSIVYRVEFYPCFRRSFSKSD